MMKLSEELLQSAKAQGERLGAYAPLLCGWYLENARDLPWRRDASPYHVWISEIMLQQTRIEAVLPHYEAFLLAFPTVADLAAAPLDVLLKQWEGLGYYSRARNLHKAAGVIVRRYGGQMPADYDALLSLPGIGEYTAGAIASIAFGIPVPAVDGNVLRVLARLTGQSLDVLSPLGKAWFSAVAAKMLPADAPGVFNSAMMELGERVCLPNTAPKCEACPLRDACEAHKAGRQTALPVRIRKTSRRTEQKTVLVLTAHIDGIPHVLLHRRPDSGLLAGLWELPCFDGALSGQEVQQLLYAMGAIPLATRRLPEGKHIFTHIEWQMQGWHVPCEAAFAYPDGEWVTLEARGEHYALPSAFRTYSALLPILAEEDNHA